MPTDPPVRILLVDDAAANLVALRSLLAGPEYELIEALSGAAALGYLLKHDCALILMDVQMPDLDGYETARLIRENERTRNIPIVFVTAYGLEDSHLHRGYASGAVDYLFKPYDPVVLRSKVAAFATLHRAQRQLLAQEEQLRLAQRRDHAHALAALELRSLRRQEAAQRRYRTLVEGVTHAVAWVAHPVTHALTFASPSVRSILGRDRDEWVGDPAPLPERVHREDRAAFAAALSGLQPGEEGARIQHRMTRADGELVWFDTSLRLLPTEEGDALELHGFSVDVTEPRRAQEALEFLARAGAELVRSLECADTAASVARVAVPDLADWCVVELSPQLTGESIRVAAHSDPALEEAARALSALPALSLAAQCDEPRVAEDLSQRLLRLDPSSAPLVMQLRPGTLLEVPLRAHGRALGRLRLFSRPERPAPGARERRLAGELGHRAAQAIENAFLYFQAREAVRLREEFLSIASHELRTPLSALSLQLRLLDGMIGSGKVELSGSGAGDFQGRVQKSGRQVDRLTNLVNSLLDLARIRSGQMQLLCERFPLGDLLRDVAGRFEDAMARAGRRLQVDPCAAVGRWDRSRLDQVVTNLVGNAVKYGGEAPISVTVQERAGWIALRVHDDGPGIPPEDIARVFDRYAQGSAGKGGTGLGLGLYIARNIVEAHGGRIRAESGAGAGTTFTVELPCEQSAGASAPRPEAREALAAAPGP
ncbi:MAG TPA: ATP-binding protein [Anaeromyxobacteraceae bacterium]|jgi:PAS domain S-box-containing protein|nr:ATP-binding protein [Anaeromyxobacteraceae bacterium]